MMQKVYVRLPKEIIKLSEILAKYEHLEKTAFLRKALSIGIESIRIEDAVKLYSSGKLTISEASDLAGVSVGEMLEILKERNVKKEIGLNDVEDSLENALRIIK